MKRYYTPEEDEHIRKHYGKKFASEIGASIGRSKDSILNRARLLGLTDTTDMSLVNPEWTDEQVAYLKENYGKLTARQIGKAIGKTKNSVIGRANRLNLNRSHRPAIQPWSEIKVREVPMGSYKQAGCQWIDGDPLRGDHTYCGEPLKEGSRFSYCAEHHKIVFRAAIPKKDRQHFRFERGR